MTPRRVVVGLRAVSAGLRLHEAVDDLVERPVTTDGDHQGVPGERALAGEIRAVARALGHGDLDGTERALDGPPHRAEGPPRRAASGGRIDDEERLHDSVSPDELPFDMTRPMSGPTTDERDGRHARVRPDDAAIGEVLHGVGERLGRDRAASQPSSFSASDASRYQ